MPPGSVQAATAPPITRPRFAGVLISIASQATPRALIPSPRLETPKPTVTSRKRRFARARPYESGSMREPDGAGP